MYRDCIASAIYPDSWATMDTASEPGVRETSFRAIPQSIKIINQSLLSTLLFLCGGYNEWGRWLSEWDPRFLLTFLREPFTIFQGLAASRIGQSGSCALNVVMGGTEIALLSQSTPTQRLQWTMLPSPGLEEPSSGISYNLL